MKKLMMMLLLVTLAFSSQADIIWSGYDDKNSGENIGEDPTFEDLKWQIVINNAEFLTQVKVCYEVVANFIEETIDYIISNLVRNNYTSEEEFEQNKQFFETKLREFKANYDSGVSYMDAYFGVRRFSVKVDEEY